MDYRHITVEEARRLRRALLYPEDGRSDVTYQGDSEASAIHVGAWMGPTLVGVASLLPQDLPSRSGGYRVRGVAIIPAVHRKGMGRELVTLGITAAQQAGARYVWCNVPESALPFFERLGFVSISDLFDVPQIGLHRRLVRILTP